MLSLYDITVPIYSRALQSLDACLGVAEKWAAENNVPESKLLEARLAPDMLPLPRQIQIASDMAKGILPRITDCAPTPMPDTESSMAELRTRLQKTLELLHAAARADFDGKEDKQVEMKALGATHQFPALAFVQQISLPNLFFHVTTAYGLLRKEGVPLGKADYLGFAQRG